MVDFAVASREARIVSGGVSLWSFSGGASNRLGDARILSKACRSCNERPAAVFQKSKEVFLRKGEKYKRK